MVHVLGRDIWLGWFMIAALIYSMIPQIILGHLKQPIARRLHDKVLYTDALMQKADWTTGVAGIAGIIGIAYGWWWADAAAALLISCEILRDGLRQLRIATAELVDGAPRELDSDDIAADATALGAALAREFPDASIRLRETGRYILAHVEGACPPQSPRPLEDYWPGEQGTAWRFAGISFDPG
jgi:divalent metal cation (Fe/Co/Zn/Cd) transporter